MMRLLSGLSLYTVHLRPTDAGKPDRIRFVREGFNWLAFAFTLFWALYHRLWLAAGYVLVLNVAAGLLADTLSLGGMGLGMVQLGIGVWFGFAANDFMRRHLQRKGFTTMAVVSGESQMRAEQRFFDRHAHFLG